MIQVIENAISNVDLANSRRIIKLSPPQNLKPLSLAIQVTIGDANSNTSLVSYDIAVEQVEA